MAVPLLYIFSSHVYRAFTKAEREKCQYQDKICGEAEELDIQYSRSSHFIAKQGDHYWVSTHGKKMFPSAFIISGVEDY